jgi:hypothetical protein
VARPPLIVNDIEDLWTCCPTTKHWCRFASDDKETCVFAVTPTTVATKIIPLGAQALSERLPLPAAARRLGQGRRSRAISDMCNSERGYAAGSSAGSVR